MICVPTLVNNEISVTLGHLSASNNSRGDLDCDGTVLASPYKILYSPCD